MLAEHQHAHHFVNEVNYFQSLQKERAKQEKKRLLIGQSIDKTRQRKLLLEVQRQSKRQLDQS